MMPSPVKKYRQVKGVECREIDDELFLIHPATEAIHHVNQIGGAVWRILAKPMAVVDINILLSDAFPDETRVQIAASTRRLLNAMKAWELIREVPLRQPRRE